MSSCSRIRSMVSKMTSTSTGARPGKGRSGNSRLGFPGRRSARLAPQGALPALTSMSSGDTSRSATGTTRPRSAISLGPRPR